MSNKTAQAGENVVVRTAQDNARTKRVCATKEVSTTGMCGRRQPGRLDRVEEDNQDDWIVWKKTTRTPGSYGRRQPGRLDRVEEENLDRVEEDNQDDWIVWKKTTQDGGSV